MGRTRTNRDDLGVEGNDGRVAPGAEQDGQRRSDIGRHGDVSDREGLDDELQVGNDLDVRFGRDVSLCGSDVGGPSETHRWLAR